jgi:hypothetical protein
LTNGKESPGAQPALASEEGNTVMQQPVSTSLASVRDQTNENVPASSQIGDLDPLPAAAFALGRWCAELWNLLSVATRNEGTVLIALDRLTEAVVNLQSVIGPGTYRDLWDTLRELKDVAYTSGQLDTQFQRVLGRYRDLQTLVSNVLRQHADLHSLMGLGDYLFRWKKEIKSSGAWTKAWISDLKRLPECIRSAVPIFARIAGYTPESGELDTATFLRDVVECDEEEAEILSQCPWDIENRMDLLLLSLSDNIENDLKSLPKAKAEKQVSPTSPPLAHLDGASPVKAAGTGEERERDPQSSNGAAQDGSSKQGRVHARFPNLLGLRWEDVIIRFFSDDSVEVRVGDVSKKYHFSELGYKDGRKGDLPDSRWKILRMMAEHNGETSWRSKISTEDRGRLSAAIKEIRRRLRELMTIEDDPFHPYRKSRGYKTKFKLVDARPKLKETTAKTDD